MKYEFFRIYKGRVMGPGLRIENSSNISDATESAHELMRRLGIPFEKGYGHGNGLFISNETALNIEKEGTDHAEKLDSIRRILDGVTLPFVALSDIRKVLDVKGGE